MTNSRTVYALVLGMLVLTIGIVAWVRSANPTHSVTLDAQGIAQELHDITELVTTHYVVQHVLSRPARGNSNGTADENTPGEAAYGSDLPLLMVQGTVVANVDLPSLRAGDIRLDQNMVTLKIPPPKITGATLDESQTRVWNDKLSMWTTRPDVVTDLHAGIRREAIAELQQAAVQSGILKEADRNAKRAISRLLMAAGMRKVVFQ